MRRSNIIGKSQAMQQVYEQILQAASSEANVVILGESGTGKELVARAIHAMSGRADHDFIPVNCGAIPENLVESEFFGHRKGAFTSAHAERKGYFDAAKEGTLFLDEVGELGLSMQVKLLRAVESGEYTMLGDTTPQKASVRIIAATSRNLREMVKRGIMREDFYYRISVISVVLPALRDRRDDIPLLVFHFIEHYARGKKVHVPGKIMEALYRYDWPGNIRELQNVIQRFLTVGKLGLEDSITKPHEGRTTIPLPEEIRSLETATDEFERCYIRKVLEENRWSKAKTAAALQIDPKTLYRKMKRVGLI
ncbi:MAG TPA: sigma-54 dependent transcriptional regulator [Thermodesulfobacteriota bacterium]|nr:sigma-54 dependent transcriptional regulator [Thermodesulfobacteriota bacterium]HNU70591.1 sigma-54 dependent transcriptional regulator [Thermodesulfobacteriota bacterium]HOC39073.1 sigma-54 dependent transcriptional regulator [Thermodesulfobacteriota bacterium]